MFKFFGNRWFTVIGAGSFALGIPGALDGFRIWGDWLSFMSGTPSTVAESDPISLDTELA